MFPQQYAAQRIEFSHGEGVYLFDNQGKKYLDFGSGIAVNSFGYGDPVFARIAAQQMNQLIHVSNLFTSKPSKKLAAQFLDLFPSMHSVHFGNSGTEAIESAMKYARLYAKKHKGPHHTTFVSFDNGFHGRTLGALSLHPNSKKNSLFHPCIPDCIQLPLNDHDAMRTHITRECAAVFLEPIQGEGGLSAFSKDSASVLQEICAENDVLIIADEIQTGLGRLGALTGSELIGLHPDIITFSKSLAAGMPLSAVLIPLRVDECIPFAAHGTTFGGGPVTCALALEILARICAPGFFEGIQNLARFFDHRIQECINVLGKQLEPRGAGLLRGIRICAEHQEKRNPIVATAIERGLIVLPSGSDVIRLAPPLIISEEEIDEGFRILTEILHSALA